MPLLKAGSNSLSGSSLFLFLARFFPSLANLLVMIWYSRHLPEAAYGQYQNFWVQLLVLSAVICFGIHVVLLTYSKEFILALIRRLKPRTYVTYFGWAVAISVVFAMLQRQGSGIAASISMPFILTYSLTLILEALMITGGALAGLVAINVVYAVVYCFIHWYALQQGFSLQSLFLCLLVLVILRLVVYVMMWSRAAAAIKPIALNDAEIGKAWALWLHLGFYDVSQILFAYVDKFIISLVLTAQFSAVYYNGSQNIPFLPLLLSAAGSAVLQRLARNDTPHNDADLVSMMKQSGKWLSCIVFPVFFFLLFYSREFMTVMFTARYAAAVPIFVMSILVLPVKAYSFTTILQRQHMGRVINIGAVGDLLIALALMYPLYRWMGLPGVALSFVISTYLQAAFYLYHSGKALHVSPLRLIPLVNWMVKLVVFAAALAIAYYLSAVHFADRNALFLGGVVTTILVTGALVVEWNNQKKEVRV